MDCYVGHAYGQNMLVYLYTFPCFRPPILHVVNYLFQGVIIFSGFLYVSCQDWQMFQLLILDHVHYCIEALSIVKCAVRTCS